MASSRKKNPACRKTCAAPKPKWASWRSRSKALQTRTKEERRRAGAPRQLRKKKLQSARVEQQRLIAIQARAAYQSGRQEYLKLLLNQQNPEKFARTLTYYDYLSQARLEQLNSFNETLRQLANVEQDIAIQQAQLLAPAKQPRHPAPGAGQGPQGAPAGPGQAQRATSKARDQKLQAREQDQADLAEVLKTIEETLARQAREAEEARQKALLAQQEAEKQRQREALAATATTPRREKRPGSAWPAGFQRRRQSSAALLLQPEANFHGRSNGRLLARFGETRGDDARAKWDGVMISASAGSPGARRTRRARGVRRLVARRRTCW